MNRRSCSDIKLLCRHKLHAIRRRSIPLRVCLGIPYCMQWPGKYISWKWMDSTTYPKRRMQYLTENVMKRCQNWWGPSPLYNNQLGWTKLLYFIATTKVLDWRIYHILGGKWEVFHKSQTWGLGLIYVQLLPRMRALPPRNTNSSLLWAFYCGFRVTYDC